MAEVYTEGRRMADDKTAAELLPAVVLGFGSGFVRNFRPPHVSRVKKRCKSVSPVIQCPRIAERLPKFREEFSAGQGAKREAPLQAFSAGTGF
jgi:hypothetical protein